MSNKCNIPKIFRIKFISSSFSRSERISNSSVDDVTICARYLRVSIRFVSMFYWNTKYRLGRSLKIQRYAIKFFVGLKKFSMEILAMKILTMIHQVFGSGRLSKLLFWDGTSASKMAERVLKTNPAQDGCPRAQMRKMFNVCVMCWTQISVRRPLTT